MHQGTEGQMRATLSLVLVLQHFHAQNAAATRAVHLLISHVHHAFSKASQISARSHLRKRSHICVYLKFDMSSKDTSLYVLPANVAPQPSHPKYRLLLITGEIKDCEEVLGDQAYVVRFGSK